jgi:cell division protein FtsI (penicillin-binding protein 3)
MKASAAALAPPKFPAWRAPAIFLLLAAGLAALGGRSLYLQGIDHAFLQEKGASRYSRDLELSAHRGRISDRNGEPLGISTPVKSVWAFASQVQMTAEQARDLARLLEITGSELDRRLSQGGDFVYLARQIPPEVAERIAKLRIRGVYDEKTYRRYYPAAEVTSQVVGFTNSDDTGLEGLELAQQEWLGGRKGTRRVIINRRGDVVEDVENLHAPQEGRDLVLSLDSKLQYLAYRELKAAVEENKAKAGSIVVLDARNGEVLALANLPSFNPNNPKARANKDRMRNRALTDVYEPGSTLKPFTIAAALEAGKVTPQTLVDTAPGRLSIGPATIHDAHPEGTLTIEQVIQKSSNVGAAKVALSLPRETMWRMLAESGFGTAPRTGFPGEVAGRLRPPHSWKPIEQATMAYGHGISVNLVQLARAYTIFASDGELKPVTLFRTSGEVHGQPVLHHETVAAMRKMLEMVTQPGGTAIKARVPGYRVGGKTGTAHKLEGRGYAARRYVSSFVGIAPMSDPRLIVAVMIDEPSAGQYYGGSVAAPVFSRVMGGALRTLGVPTDAPVDNTVLPDDDEAVREET